MKHLLPPPPTSSRHEGCETCLTVVEVRLLDDLLVLLLLLTVDMEIVVFKKWEGRGRPCQVVTPPWKSQRSTGRPTFILD